MGIKKHRGGYTMTEEIQDKFNLVLKEGYGLKAETIDNKYNILPYQLGAWKGEIEIKIDWKQRDHDFDEIVKILIDEEIPFWYQYGSLILDKDGFKELEAAILKGEDVKTSYEFLTDVIGLNPEEIEGVV